MRLQWMIRIAAASLICACDSADGPVLDSVYTGTWEWTSSVGGIAAMQHTPGNDGYHVRLELTGDGQARAYRDQQHTLTSDFSASPDTAEDGSIAWVLTFTPPLKLFDFDTLDEDTARVTGTLSLQLTDPCCDRFAHTFQKPLLH